MKSVSIISLILCLLLTVSLSPGLAEQTGRYSAAGITDEAAVEKFFTEFQTAVAKDEREKVASAVAYPVTVRILGRRVKLKKKEDLLKRYEVVFHEKVKQAVARARLADLFVNYQGIMMGNGEIWFNEINGVLQVTAINN